MKRGEAVDVHLLNLAKMDKVEQWLEKEKPAAVDDVLRRLERAIVKSFTKTGKNKLGTRGMSLIFWTAAGSDTITKTFGASLKSFRPNVPPHQFVPIQSRASLTEPGEGDVVLAAA